MPRKAWLLQLTRKVHLYFGLLISPSLLFFAFTGAVQTLGYHEASANYNPPALLASLGQIHKKQTYLLPARRAPGGSGEGARPDSAAPAVNPSGSASGPVSPEGTTPRQHREDQPGSATPSPNAAGPTPPASGSPSGSQPAHTDALSGSQARNGAQNSPTLEAKQKQHLPLKLFFVLVSLGLFTSTFTGIYMAYKYDRNKVLVTLLLVAGVVLPIVLVNF